MNSNKKDETDQKTNPRIVTLLLSTHYRCTNQGSATGTHARDGSVMNVEGYYSCLKIKETKERGLILLLCT